MDPLLLDEAIAVTKKHAGVFGRRVPPFIQRDDLRQEAFMRMLKHLPDYDPSRGSLDAFLREHTRGAVQDYLRKSEGYSRHNGKTHLVSLIISGNDNSETETRAIDIPDPSADSELECISRVISDLTKELKKYLPQRYWLVLVLYYWEEKTFVEIGEFLGVNESRVSQIHSAALNTLSGVLYSMGITRLSQIID